MPCGRQVPYEVVTVNLPIARVTVVEYKHVPDTLSQTSALLVEALKSALSSGLSDSASMDPAVFDIPGMSGKRYRCLINNLIHDVANARYLEIGSWAGSTLCSAINGNTVMATAIDNWSQFGGPKTEFMANLDRFRTPRAYVNFIEKDFREVDYSSIGPFNIYLFDGPHDEQDHYEGLHLVQAALDDTFILIVDDWNWKAVRDGTEKAVAACQYVEHLKVEIRSSVDDTHPDVFGPESDWHNGYYIAVLSKPKA